MCNDVYDVKKKQPAKINKHIQTTYHFEQSSNWRNFSAASLVFFQSFVCAVSSSLLLLSSAADIVSLICFLLVLPSTVHGTRITSLLLATPAKHKEVVGHSGGVISAKFVDATWTSRRNALIFLYTGCYVILYYKLFNCCMSFLLLWISFSWIFFFLLGIRPFGSLCLGPNHRV